MVIQFFLPYFQWPDPNLYFSCTENKNEWILAIANQGQNWDWNQAPCCLHTKLIPSKTHLNQWLWPTSVPSLTRTIPKNTVLYLILDHSRNSVWKERGLQNTLRYRRQRATCFFVVYIGTSMWQHSSADGNPITLTLLTVHHTENKKHNGAGLQPLESLRSIFLFSSLDTY